MTREERYDIINRLSKKREKKRQEETTIFLDKRHLENRTTKKLEIAERLKEGMTSHVLVEQQRSSLEVIFNR